MKLPLNVHFAYDHVFSWTNIIAFIVMENACCPIFGQVGPIMTTSAKVPSYRISTQHWMWWGKRWKTFFFTCVRLSKAIDATICQKVSWAIVCSLPHKHQNKWIPKSSIVCPHSHYERCVTIGCDKPKWVHIVVRKWTKDKQNASVVGQVNN
jgi:hypothetical protein